jgi:hypothetical protein
MQVAGLNAIRGSEIRAEAETRPALSLDIKDVYAAGEPVTAHVRVISSRDPAGEPAPVALIESATGVPAPVGAGNIRWGDDHWIFEATGLPPGLYRIAVTTPQPWPVGPPKVEDAFAVSE